MTFGEYLEGRGIGNHGRLWRERMAAQWLAWLRERRGIADVTRAEYGDVMAYVGELQGEGRSEGTVNRALVTIRHYLAWRGLADATYGTVVRGRQRAAAPPLLSAGELDAVWSAFAVAEGTREAIGGRSGYAVDTDALMLGLVIYQGLGQGELARLEVSDVDLAAGVVRAPGTRHRSAREVPLEGHQVLTWQAYLRAGGGRERAVAGAARWREEAGMPEASDGVGGWLFPSAGNGGAVGRDVRLMSQFTKLKRRVRAVARAGCGIEVAHLQRLRQSRIGVWVERYGLRRAQHLAGLATVAAVERYRRGDFDDLARELGEHHPLG